MFSSLNSASAVAGAPRSRADGSSRSRRLRPRAENLREKARGARGAGRCEEGTREATEVSGPLGRRADAMVKGRATAPARVGGGDELEASREIADAARP